MKLINKKIFFSNLSFCTFSLRKKQTKLQLFPLKDILNRIKFWAFSQLFFITKVMFVLCMDVCKSNVLKIVLFTL